MDSYIPLDAPLSSLLGVSPRLADKAAPAAFCWDLDFAGITRSFRFAIKRLSQSNASSAALCATTTGRNSLLPQRNELLGVRDRTGCEALGCRNRRCAAETKATREY